MENKDESLKKHQDYVESHCRVCGKKLGAAKYSVNDHQSIVEGFGLNTSRDVQSVHPQHFCNSCYLTAQRNTTKSTPLKRNIINWLPHNEVFCDVCDVKCKGGRPKKKTSGGRPSALTQHIKSVSSSTFNSPIPIASSRSVENASYFTCAFCKSFARHPIEIQPCKSMACSQCCLENVSGKNLFHCLGCQNEHEASIPAFTQISPRANKVLNDILVESKDKVTLEDVLHQPLQAVPTNLEKKVVSNVVARIIHQEGDVVTLPRRGKSISLVKITNSDVPSSLSSKSTKRRRTNQLSRIRGKISGGDMQEQMVDELKAIPVEERLALMKEANFMITIPPEQGLAMKSDLSIPWRKLRIMRRWMKSWGVSMASEGKQRTLMTTQLSSMPIEGEVVPFSFKIRSGNYELRPAPLVFVNDLKSMIFHLLDEKHKLGQLTWHNGMIPPNEIWVKLGGDKGVTSFKTSIQILNVDKPNSVRNSCVFCVFEAPDTSTNLYIALNKFKHQISDLQRSLWNGYHIRLFMSGDYEFLCNMYGISGASGRHCCLWCTITSDKLIIPKASRTNVNLRSLEHLTEKYGEFMRDGGNLKKAKLHDNVIGEFFFDIPLSQVCPPGLHISLGIFQRLFNLLEEECFELDKEITLNSPSSSQTGSNTFQNYQKAKEALSKLRDEKISLTSELNQCQQVLIVLLLTVPNPLQNTRVLTTTDIINGNTKKINDIDIAISKQEAIIGKGFDKEDGLFVKTLDNVLDKMNIQRQAYYGGTFIGNHVHKALKHENIEILCKSIVDLATEHDSSLIPKAVHTSEKFKNIFSLFSSCHKVYDSGSLLSDDDIDALERSIHEFVTMYRSNFPKASFLPKMHMLEDHMTSWLRNWRVGCGYMGEQGAESLHASFNSTERAYNSMKDRVARLKSVLQNHHLQVMPAYISLEPPLLRKRKRTEATD